jgi:hypothetical protein
VRLKFSNIIKNRSYPITLIKKEDAVIDRTKIIPGSSQEYTIKVPVFHLTAEEVEAYEGGEYTAQDIRIHEPEILRGYGVYDIWQAGFEYGADKLIKPTDEGSRLYYKCTQGGKAGDIEPTWPENIGSTVQDNEVDWETAGYIEQRVTVEKGDEVIYQSNKFEVMDKKEETVQADYNKCICKKVAGDG